MSTKEARRGPPPKTSGRTSTVESPRPKRKRARRGGEPANGARRPWPGPPPGLHGDDLLGFYIDQFFAHDPALRPDAPRRPIYKVFSVLDALRRRAAGDPSASWREHTCHCGRGAGAGRGSYISCSEVWRGGHKKEVCPLAREAAIEADRSS